MRFAPTQRVETVSSGDADNVPAWEHWDGRTAKDLCMLGEGTKGFVASAEMQLTGLQQDVIGEYVYLIAFDFGRFLFIQERYLNPE